MNFDKIIEHLPEKYTDMKTCFICRKWTTSKCDTCKKFFCLDCRNICEICEKEVCFSCRIGCSKHEKQFFEQTVCPSCKDVFLQKIKDGEYMYYCWECWVNAG